MVCNATGSMRLLFAAQINKKARTECVYVRACVCIFSRMIGKGSIRGRFRCAGV